MLTTKNWRATLALAAAALGLVAALAGCTPPGPRALLEGERLIRAGKYSQAIESLQLAVRVLPSNAQTWNHLGLAYHKAGQPQNALKAYEQARRCDLNLTPVRYNLGCLLLEQNNLQPAIAELTAYTLLEENSADGWVKLATAQLRARQWDAAERSFRSALQLRPALAPAWNALGIIHTQRGRPKDALTCFTTALQKAPAYGPAVLNSAILYHHHLNNNDLALQKYQDFLRLEPTARDAALVKEIVRQLKAGPALAAQGEEPHVASVLPRRSTPPPFEAQASPTIVVKNEPAAAGAHSAPSVANRSGEPHTQTAQKLEPTESAQTTPGFEQPSEPPAIRAHRSEVALAEKSADLRAIQPPSNAPSQGGLLREIPPPRTETVVATPESVPAQPAIQPPKTGVVQLSDEPPVKVAEDQASSSSQPQVAPAQPDPAETAAPREPLRSETIVRAEPPERESRTVLDRLNPVNWFKSRRPGGPFPTPLDGTTEAGTSPSAFSSSPNPAGPLQSVERVAWASIPRYGYRALQKPAAGDRFGAQGSFTQAVEAHRDRRLAEAMADYQKAAALDPAFYEAYYNLGLAAYESKDWPLSLSAYEAALSINPTSANCRYNFALALEQAGYFLDAADELEKLLAQHPGEARAHLTLASLYADALGKPVLARPHYRKVLELEPQHSQAPAIRYWLAANP